MGEKKTTPKQKYQKAYIPASSLTSICNFMYVMIVSNILVSLPLIGGALYLCGRSTLALAHTFVGGKGKQLSRGVRWGARGLLGLILLACAFFLGIFPISPQSPMLWIIFGIVLASLFRENISKNALHHYLTKRWKKKGSIGVILAIHFIALGTIWLLLSYTLPLWTAFLVWAGFFLCGLIEIYDQWKNQKTFFLPPISNTIELRELSDKLQEINAYHAFRVLYNFFVIGLYLTIVLLCTYIVISAQGLFIYMLISFVCIIFSKELATYLGEKMKRSKRDPAYIGALGTVFWLAGILLFGRYLTVEGQEIISYLALGLSYFGASLCSESLAIFEKDMEQVAIFSMGEEGAEVLEVRRLGKEVTNIIGETIALVLLLVLATIEGFRLPQDPMEMAAAFQPLLIFPAIIIIITVLIGVLQFPISKKYREKLVRFINISQEGETNEQLNKQLENVVVKKHKRPFMLRVLIVLARPFFRHKVIGEENVPKGKDGQLVFICNHGSIYGPIAIYLYLPFYVRPWSISDLMIDKDEIAAYMYKYDVSTWKWMPKRLQYPFARYIIAPASKWFFKSLEAIPVYRNKPRELMNTFRLSLQAMMAEDNLLIFPENPDAKSLEKPGYVQEGTGEFYTGFTMLAPLMHTRTGKVLEFIPVYASKNQRVISIGEPVVYDPDRQPTEEKLRIAQTLQDRMNAMAENLEKDCGKEKKK